MVTVVEKIRMIRSQWSDLLSALFRVSSAKMAFGANLRIGIPDRHYSATVASPKVTQIEADQARR
jgi:hypothetical protein